MRHAIEAASEPRYQLTLSSYPNEDCIRLVCELIYQTTDKNLLGSLSTLPYTIGRSFSIDEAKPLSEQLKNLKVAFRFHSSQAGLEDIAYDPKSQTILPIENSKFNFNTLKRRIIISAFVILFVTVPIYLSRALWTSGYLPNFSSLFSPSAPKTTSARNDSEKAQTELAPLKENEVRLEKIVRDVEFRKEKDLTWNKAEPLLVLKTDDSLRTYADSQAFLRYEEGSLVIVKPSTLLIIGSNPESPSHRSLRLDDGKLQANLKASDIPQSLSIKTPSGVLELTKNPEDKAETKIETNVSGGVLTVAVTKGTATLRPVSKEAPAIELKSLQQVTATKTSVSEVVAYSPTLTLFSPENETELLVDPRQSEDFSFQWENLGTGASYTFELATDSEMKSVLLKQEISTNEVRLSFLDLGNLYWRVKAVFDGVTYTSPIWRMHVEKHHN